MPRLAERVPRLAERVPRLAERTLCLAWDGLAAAPEELAVGLGRAVGAAAWRPLGLRRRVVEAQLARAFPERPADWVRRVAKQTYLHFGRELAVTPRLAREGPEAVQGRLVNPEAVRQVRAAVVPPGSGCVLVTGHLGNWELAGAALAAAGAPVLAAVQTQGKAVDPHLTAARRNLGVCTVPFEGSVRLLRSALERGVTVALVADQHAGAAGVRLPFLGRPASTFRSPARLALELGVPLLFGALVREGSGYRALLEEVGAGSGSADDVQLTRGWLSRLEREVRERPSQYFWFHRRWKEGGRELGGPRPGGCETRLSTVQ